MADDTFTIKRNDTWRPIRLTLQQALVATPDPENPADWAPMDLSEVQVAHIWMRSGSASIKTSPVVILDPTQPDPLDPSSRTPVGDGNIAYYWQSPADNPDDVADTSIAGTYQAEVELTYNDGNIETVPRGDYFTVVIVEDLGQAS